MSREVRIYDEDRESQCSDKALDQPNLNFEVTENPDGLREIMQKVRVEIRRFLTLSPALTTATLLGAVASVVIENLLIILPTLLSAIIVYESHGRMKEEIGKEGLEAVMERWEKSKLILNGRFFMRKLAEETGNHQELINFYEKMISSESKEFDKLGAKDKLLSQIFIQIASFHLKMLRKPKAIEPSRRGAYR